MTACWTRLLIPSDDRTPYVDGFVCRVMATTLIATNYVVFCYNEDADPSALDALGDLDVFDGAHSVKGTAGNASLNLRVVLPSRSHSLPVSLR